MAKLTIEQLRKQYKTAQEQAAEKAEEIRQAEKALAALRREQENAAKAGDVERFDMLAEQIQKEERRIYVLIKSADTSGRVTPEDARAAWTEYAQTFGKNQGAKLAAYDKARRELCREYEGLVAGQNNALRAREELAAMAGTDAGSYDLPEWIPTAIEKDAPRTFGEAAPDAELFTRMNYWPCNFDLPYAPGLPHWAGIETVDKVVCRRVPVERLDFGHK